MKTTFTGTMQPLDTTIPDPALIVMIGASGSGKSTLASSWPATQVLELDAFRAMIADDAGDQSATEAAITVMHAALKARMARRLTTVISATSLMIGCVQASGEASVARLVRGVGARSGAVGITAV
ncbi:MULTISPECIES: AAA family ATPase [unclassified Streptomyces]|uniref:AAA family ATPase n=1 Tax=unclassified Streptomyces TaxID=2593676 RepID=UPI002B1D4274|nr:MULTISPECIES: AAA family ATPase [unclassified Streptomyces]